jgi:hypothetical protein
MTSSVSTATPARKARRIPTLDQAGAKALMERIFTTKTLDVSVFVDGRGLNPAEISIIKDGDGQSPLAYIDHATFQALEQAGDIHTNNMVPYKSRRNHQYRGSGWLGEFGQHMMGAATAIPRLTGPEKRVVGRAVRRYIGNRETPKSWARTKEGDTQARFEGAGLLVTFGWSAQGGRYLSAVRRLARKGTTAFT